MSEIKYYSEEGLQKLKDELHQLIAFDRPAAAAAIAEAPTAVAVAVEEDWPVDEDFSEPAEEQP